MKRILVGVAVVVLVGVGVWYFRSGAAEPAAPAGAAAGGRGAGPGGPGGGRGGRGMVPMTVEIGTVDRGEMVDYVTVVGNLIGEATVEVVPRIAGRIEAIYVKLGDPVTRGQAIAKIEDRAIREQVNQVRANLEVNRATLAARQNDVEVARNALDRARASFERGLLSQASLEDAEARYNAAVSQVTVAEAQLVSTQARLDELLVSLADTDVVSPVDGFVGRRDLDPGAFATANTAIVSLVDISTVRMVANLIEKDFRRVRQGAPAIVEVDAFPGEQFTGQVSRVAPVFDPATRTATMEIEVPNPGFRLKPGMYARVRLTAERKPDALVVARSAVVDLQGRRGVYVVDENDVARFQEVETGVSDGERIEIVRGLEEGTRVVTTGALAVRDGERVLSVEAVRPPEARDRARGADPNGTGPA
ncbi:MAG: efflux RND transporter periplasmic adaptor subunit [Acidobacteriota bacterium]